MTPGKSQASRGYKSVRCAACQLPTARCICHLTPTIHTFIQFWLLMHPDEGRKPTNTARLIAATMPHTRVFVWQHTAPPPGLLDLLGSPCFAPYVVFPHGDIARFERLPEDPWHADKVPAFVLLDGTWSQTRKMFVRSTYLRGMPCLTLPPTTPSAYTLRQQRSTGYLSTVEVAIALLAQMNNDEASNILGAYFRVFTASGLAARQGHPLPEPLLEMQQLLEYRCRHSHRGGAFTQKNMASWPAPDCSL
jgi:DTW domain-containing protein YfiP